MSRLRTLGLAASSLLAVACSGTDVGVATEDATALPAGAIRVATFNATMHRSATGELVADLSSPDDVQARASAEIIQRVRPDVLLLQEFDWDAEGKAAKLFQENYLSVAQNGQEPIEYAHRLVPTVNIGIPSGLDFDNDGKKNGPGDAFGFGEYPGKYGFVVYSRYPIDEDAVRTFQKFLWKDMPGATMPKHKNGAAYYTKAERDKFRLSSKNHVDVPIDVNGQVFHLLAHHPTPPAFDGPEDRNGLRNYAEIRLWADYISPDKSGYLTDDNGKKGGLAAGEQFVIVGDHNSDPNDGSSRPGAIAQLLSHARVAATLTPTSEGGRVASELQGGVNNDQAGDPAQDTSDFFDGVAGNLRLDYVLPSEKLAMLDAQVFWPAQGSAEAALIKHSDHRLTWADLMVTGTPPPPSGATAPSARQSLDGYSCPSGAVKVAFLDADSTLRISRSGAPTANTPDDVYVLPFAAGKIAELHAQGYLTAIVSNQGGVAGGQTSLEAAVGGVVTVASLVAKQGGTIDYLDIAEAYDHFRKPETGMAEKLEELLQAKCGVGIDWPASQMIGDAGYKKGSDGPHPDGRPADDFSNSDRLFAENLDIAFSEPTDAWGWRAFEVYNIHTKWELLSFYEAIEEELAALEASGGDPARIEELRLALDSRALNGL